MGSRDVNGGTNNRLRFHDGADQFSPRTKQAEKITAETSLLSSGSLKGKSSNALLNSWLSFRKYDPQDTGTR